MNERNPTVLDINMLPELNAPVKDKERRANATSKENSIRMFKIKKKGKVTHDIESRYTLKEFNQLLQGLNGNKSISRPHTIVTQSNRKW